MLRLLGNTPCTCGVSGNLPCQTSNTLVMGPGGYRFGDYWRLGLPLSLIVIVLGTALISLFWPL